MPPCPGVKLSNGENTFAYILDESKAPSGYAARQPQVVTVTVDQEAISTPGGSNYLAGRTGIQRPQHQGGGLRPRGAGHREGVGPQSAPAGATVTLELYRVTHEVRKAQLGRHRGG